MTDRQTDKTTRWAFTAYEAQWPLFETMPELVAEWGWQQEICPKTQRPHYQGYIRTKRQVRFGQIQKAMLGVHIERAINWDALINYCKKPETAVEGTQRHEINPSKAMTMAQALDRLATQGDVPEAPSHWDEKENREKLINDMLSDDYWRRVMNLLREDANLIGIYSQPQYLRAWLKTFPVWMERQTDRQTPEEEEA